MTSNEHSSALKIQLAHDYFPENQTAPFNHVKISGPNDSSLKISFMRTVRVADNADISDLPAGLGTFPLYQTNDYANKMACFAASEGGYFLPMYHREATWISFTSYKSFAVKIYAGGVNIVSGEQALETEATVKRRQGLLECGSSIQDYVVTPDQMWLDGIAHADGTVRQLVAVPMNSGYSVEAQITGQDCIGGLQFEIKPAHVVPREPYQQATVWTPDLSQKHPQGCLRICARSHDHTISYIIRSDMKLAALMKSFCEQTQTDPASLRFISGGMRIRQHESCDDVGLIDGDTIEVMAELVGGGGPNPSYARETAIGAGGKITQVVEQDKLGEGAWDVKNTAIFNLTILNSEDFKLVTGQAPPDTPITAKTYASHGLPWYEIYDDQPSGIYGNFSDVKSVNQLDKVGPFTKDKMRAAVQVDESIPGPVVLLDIYGNRRGFRSLSELEKETVISSRELKRIVMERKSLEEERKRMNGQKKRMGEEARRMEEQTKRLKVEADRLKDETDRMIAESMRMAASG